MVDHVEQSRKAAIMVETTLLVRPQSSQWRGTIAFIGRPVRLKIVYADLGGEGVNSFV